MLVLALCAVHTHVAFAQSPADDPGHLEVAFGTLWIGSQALGARPATETTPTLSTLTLFDSSSTLNSAPGLEGRIGWRIMRSLTVEAEASVAQPELAIAITNDREDAPVVTLTERLQQFTIGGAVVWSLPVQLRRVRPFITGGAGYLRQLHENATLVQTGRYYQFGGGFAVLLASRPDSFLKAMGLRIDARGMVRMDGVAFDSTARLAPAAGASFFVRF